MRGVLSVLKAERAAGWAVCGVALGLAGGCLPPPRGEATGRVEVTDTTPAERNSRLVMPTALVEFGDQVSSQLAADLSQIPELNEGVRSTVVFGDIVNKTGIVPTTDFEAFRTRTRAQLMQSQRVLRNIRFVENRQRLESLRRREGGGGDVLQEGAGGRTPALNEEHTFFLNGEMYRVTRGSDESVNLYLLNFNLTRMSDGAIVWTNSPYEIKQVR